ncbi:ABC transporter ATP-binding protein [Neolewinella aurantiaca]|uniref:ABC transporter ATP-binding protein n=1 Tax=Neolewinella aurantiaca TaxID=2602767 RepID=A0A5C7F790_9BACT|nr:ABC transporter ATP-binding protein [Neolewinella aurantiaca]TXF85440.1 ABC transporter ATP-binding protein [Neolewinella aurantiaca]
MEKQPLIQVSGLHKKFSSDLRRGLLHGAQDMWRDIVSPSRKNPGLRKGEFYSLRDINMTLYSGEILAIVGVNGSGKTTLMRLISGIYNLDGGTITSLPGLKLTAIFALSAGMQPLFTGRENIYIKGSMYGMTLPEIEAKVPFIESFSELGDRLDRPFGNYSSGMKARLAYSIAMATNPDVFIIDESLAVGDSAFKAKCMDNLREFVNEPGKGVIFITNHIRKILKVADRLLVLDKGSVIHEAEDVGAGLEFYINNCNKHLGAEMQKNKLAVIKSYEL